MYNHHVMTALARAAQDMVTEAQAWRLARERPDGARKGRP